MRVAGDSSSSRAWSRFRLFRSFRREQVLSRQAVTK